MPEHIPAVELDEIDYESLGGGSLVSNLLAGAFAGIMEHTVMYPIDAIKTRMQIMNPSPSAMYNGIAHAAGKISATEGVRSLWRGIASVAVGAGPAHAIYFATYESVKHNLGGNIGNEHHPFVAGFAGACATTASDALMNPFDVVKQRMQVHGSTYKSIGDCAKTVYRLEGLKAFYISYPTTLAMTIPFTAIQFAAYDSLSKFFNPRRGYDPMSHCLSGGLAGAVAASVTTPLDVIKTLLQTRGTARDERIRNCKGLFDAAKIIHEREGMRGFMRGLQPRIVTTMPSTAICWTAYEMAKFYLIRNSAESSRAS
ncbi:mitochondrial carrier domain-containing protein [Tricharina praecox]|uniref:mitochondrial carrier domain-containing protein n=1 Tax=Tricharina praecox TaxID=43433 RepID=UPI00221F3D53|nr:mitochondrial carrier domain-containing protein [Tricharina praecox]KAI5858131.1 mitochondrial carrier domain-containing protein [Tricharina praecox]